MKNELWKIGIIAAVFLSVVFGSPSNSRADFTVYDNLGANNSYGSNGYSFGKTLFTNDYTEIAAQFKPSASGSLSGFVLGMFSLAGSNNVKLSLMSDANGSLGDMLWSQTFSKQLGSYSSTLSISNLSGPMMNSGSSYWLVAATDSAATQAWNRNNLGIRGAYAVSLNGVWGYNSGLNDTLAMQVTANDVTPTPLPAAAWLFGSGLAGLIGLRKKKRQ